MSSLVDAREAFRQGYVRAAFKAESGIHVAFRQGWDHARIERLLHNFTKEADIEAQEFELVLQEQQKEQP